MPLCSRMAHAGVNCPDQALPPLPGQSLELLQKGHVMAGIIDADTHIIESEPIWQHFDEELGRRRPSLVAFPDPTTGDAKSRWVIDGKLFPKPHGKGGV